ncbi:MAG: hypothetical protein WBM47_00555 [Polyangiales bacterium]
MIARKEATNNTQLFAHELTHAAVTICFPGARPWLHEGMAPFWDHGVDAPTATHPELR